MKVLHVITGLNSGGVEGFLKLLISRTQDISHHVVSLTDLGSHGENIQSLGVPVSTLHLERGKINIRAIKKLGEIANDWQPTVVKSWMYHGNLVATTLRIGSKVPIIWGIHNTKLSLRLSSKNTIAVSGICSILSHIVPKKVVYCGDKAAEVHFNRGYSRRNAVVIPNGCDVERFAPNIDCRNQLRAKLNIKETMPLIGMVARFDPWKNHHSFLSALAKLKGKGINFKALLVGADVDKNNKALINKIRVLNLADDVILFGLQKDIPGIMNAIDIHVLPSIAEAFPTVLLEAMSSGVPCVSTRVGDAAEILGSTGWISKSPSSPDIGNAIECALAEMQNSKTWSNRKTEARNHILHRFTIERTIKAYREIFASHEADLTC